MKRIFIRLTKENFSKRRKALGICKEELRSIIQSGENGTTSHFIDQIEIAVNELEKQNLGILQRDLVKKIPLEVPEDLADRFNKITITKLGEDAMWRKLNEIDGNLHQNLEEYGQEGAERRFQKRKQRAKNNGPKLILDNQEDSMDEGKT